MDAPHHSRYPPFYPALLALWAPLVGGRFDGLVLLNIGLSTAALGLLYRTVARRWNPALALACLAPLAVNTYLVELAGTVRSEPLYLFLTMGAVAVLAEDRPRARLLLAAGSAAILAALTRSIGVAIVAAVGVHWILERRKLATSAFTVAAVLGVGGWLLWTAVAPEQFAGRSYVADLTFDGASADSPALTIILLERIFRNIPAYLFPSLGYHLAVPNIRGTTVDNLVVAVVLAGALLVGLGVLLRRWRIAGLYLLAYGGILLIWPWVSGRFLLPILPLLLVAILLGLRAIGGVMATLLTGASAVPPGERTSTTSRVTRWSSAGGSRTAWVAVLGFVLATTLWASARTGSRIVEMADCERGSSPPSASCVWPDQASFFDALRYIDRELPEDAILLSAKPEPLYYYTGRLTAPIDRALTLDPEAFLPYLRDHGTGHILLGSLQQAEVGRLAHLLEATCQELALVEEFPPRTYLLRIRAPGEPPGEDGCDAVAASRRANVGRDFSEDR